MVGQGRARWWAEVMDWGLGVPGVRVEGRECGMQGGCRRELGCARGKVAKDGSRVFGTGGPVLEKLV